MKYRWLVVAGILFSLLTLAAVAFADSPMRFFINGQEIKPDFKPQIINGQIMVPMRWLAEALGANLDWDREFNIVKVSINPDERAKMLQSVTRLTPREPGGAKYYPRAPEKITTPEMALQAYFDALYHAANLNPAQMAAAGGTVAMDKGPYPTAYGYWSKEWQAENDYDKFLASWKGTVNVELLKLLPAGEADGRQRFFVETRHLEAAGEKPRFGYFYYTGFFTVAETVDGWRIAGGGLEPENPGWKLGGHQPWRGNPESVALVELAGSIDAPLGKAVSENNADGTVTVKFVDSIGKETHRAVLVQPQDGIWRVLDKR